MASVSKRKREAYRPRIKSLGDHKDFLKRISKSLYYGKLPALPCLSLPVTEISADLFSEAQKGRSLKRLHLDEAAAMSRNACVSPCSLVLAILYLERLRTCNPDYLAHVAPSELFLVSLMVSNKFLHDNGEEDEVFCDEWALSGHLELPALKHLEISFLNAIDWRVYVSEESFEIGLAWLEKQVALKQARLRGYFTYADLCNSTDYADFSDVIKSFSSTCLAATLSYITSLITLVTSTLILSQTCLPAMYHSTSLSMTSDLSRDAIRSNSNTIDVRNSNVHSSFNSTQIDLVEDELESVEDRLKCCSDWQEYDSIIEESRHFNWYDRLSFANLDSNYESWWSRTSVLNWLYQSSLISPVQKWLEKAGDIGGFARHSVFDFTSEKFNVDDICAHSMKRPHNERKCRWRDLNRFDAMVVSFYDR